LETEVSTLSHGRAESAAETLVLYAYVTVAADESAISDSHRLAADRPEEAFR